MSWDFRLSPLTRDLEPGWVTGPDEIIQRLITRLRRELGEWFLNTSAGLPWYRGGRGLLGAGPGGRRTLELLIRRETLGTRGVLRILKMNLLFPAGGRTCSVYLELLLEGVEGSVTLTIDGE